MTLGEKLKQIRNQNGSTLREVEETTGISNAYLSQLERGRAKNPSMKVLFKLADFYGVANSIFIDNVHSTQPITAQPFLSDRLVASSGLPSKDNMNLGRLVEEANLSDEGIHLAVEYIKFLRSQHAKE